MKFTASFSCNSMHYFSQLYLCSPNLARLQYYRSIWHRLSAHCKRDKQTTVTFEYASKLKYGDFFIFADRRHNDVGDQTYFEASPRLSLGAVTGKELKFGPVKDVLLATTWEAGSNMDNFLYGIGLRL